MALGKSKSSRRRELRKVMPRRDAAVRRLLGRREFLWGTGYALLFVVAASAIVLPTRLEPAFQIGELVDRPQVARVDFRAVDPEATRQARDYARARTPAIYTPNNAFFEELSKALVALPVVTHVDRFDQIAPPLVDQFALTEDVLEHLRPYAEDDQATEEWVGLVTRYMRALSRTAILRSDDFQMERANVAGLIRARLPDNRTITFREQELVNLSDTDAARATLADLTSMFPEPIRSHVVAATVRAGEPTLIQDRPATEQARRQAATDVRPIEQSFAANRVFLAAGERVSEHAFDLMRAEIAAYRTAAGPTGRWLAALGQVLVVMAVAAAVAAAVWMLRPRVAANPMRGLALLGLLVISLVAAWTGANVPRIGAGAPVFAVLLVGFILAVAYDRRFALTVSAIQAALVAFALDLTLGMALVTIVGVTVAIAQLGEVRHRGTLVRTATIAGGVVLIGTLAVGLAERTLTLPGMLTMLANDAMWSGLAGVSVGFLVLGVLPFIERAFRVTTSMTLLELSDVNHPLLRRLAQSAPGTYNHSLQIASLAEAAAEAIGANGLLCRVGAYYHDIGKMNKPEYFIENQGGGPNRHDKLSPAMSLLIIVGHVKDGNEMAREYKLPPVIQHFIESHHGTTLVEYFYHAAKEQRGKLDTPSEFEYRYPGPKPQTREAAIMMICDGVEGAARVMPEPNAGRIEQLVHTMIYKRLTDGQFDECGLTFDELRLIERAVVKSMCGIYHTRVAYPSEPAKDKDPDKRAAV